MSLLDINGYGGENGQTAADIVGYTKHIEDMTSIFDEIEHLLLHNECLENGAKVTVPSDASTPSILTESNKCNGVSSVNEKSTSANFNKVHDHLPLEFLSTCNASSFLIPEDTNALPEELSLYTVKQNELEPINSPFMVPGIYKKIATAAADITNAGLNGGGDASNVFLSAKETCGRIVSRNDFKKMYVPSLNSEQNTLAPTTEQIVEQQCEKNTEVNKPADSEWDDLSKLACSIFKLSETDHIVIDRKRREVIRTQATTNQKTIYRFTTPEALNLQPPPANYSISRTGGLQNKPIIKSKLGRPKKRGIDEVNKNKHEIVSKHSKEQPSLQQQKVIKVDEETNATKNALPQLRTRFGRVVKLIKPLQTKAAVKDLEDIDDPAEVNSLQLPGFLNELKDSDFHYNEPTKPSVSPKADMVPLAASSPTKRRVPPEAICPTCGKIFLGRRLQRHFIQNPDHMRTNITQVPPTTPQMNSDCAQDYANEEMTLFRFLIAKIQKSNLNEDQRADLFLNEINDLVEQLQLRSSRLIRNTSGLHFVTARTARVLGIPEGQYALDMSAIEAPPEIENNCLVGYEQKSLPAVVTVSTRSLDYTALSLDDTLTDEAAQKLNLSAGGKLLPPSEESLLRAVGDLVPQGAAKLVSTSLLHPPRNVGQSSTVAGMVPHYDHVSDNAVEAMSMKDSNATQQETPIMGLAVDFFQFKNN